MKNNTRKEQRHISTRGPVKTSPKAVSTNKKSTTARNTKDFDMKVGRTTLHLTNQDKIYWPNEKYTKGDLIKYYEQVADVMIPYLEDRPQSMNRFPNGINAPSFFHKDVTSSVIPAWLKTEEIYSTSNKGKINYLVCNDKASLLYMANLGCIEINPWNSRIYKL